MNQHIQKFESLMFEYCSDQAEKSYKFFEDRESEHGLEYLAHLADVLLLLKESRSTTGSTNINGFVNRCNELDDTWKEPIWVFLQQNGFGQYLPE
jgi:hypothetical protein